MEPECTPFLCNIVQPSKRNVTLGMSLTFLSPRLNSSAMDITGVDQVDDSVAQPKQGKRPRYSLFPKPIIPRADLEVSSILQTPPINRSRRSAAVAGSFNRPASILKDKMNRFMNNSVFESDQAVVSDALHSESEAEVEVVETSKHLRFSLPQVVSTTTSESEAVDCSDRDEDMEVAEEKSLVESAQEEFLSFDEDRSRTPTPAKLTTIHDTAQTADVNIKADGSICEMDVTTMLPIVVPPTFAPKVEVHLEQVFVE